MACMEVWGGNQTVNSAVVMAGLDAWVFSRPYQNADGGGDVYYVSSCATGRINRLLLADVSGHGAGVAEIARDLRTMMRKFINYIDQTKFVLSMNSHFTEATEDSIFATAIVTTFFAPTNTLTLCNAGHPPPLLYRSAIKQWMYLDGRGDGEAIRNVPLGIFECEYEQFEVRLGVGDLVLCYSDCLPEARYTSGEMLGQAGLLELIRSLDVQNPATLFPALIDAVGRMNPQNLDADDLTTLLFRPNGLAPNAPMKDRLLGPFRVLGSLARSVFDRSVPASWPELSIANIGGAIFPALGRWQRRRKNSLKPPVNTDKHV